MTKRKPQALMHNTWPIATAAALTIVLLMPTVPTTQTPDQPVGGMTEALELVPIDCRWQASASAVRVGEIFSVVLTCAVLETASTTVSPDQSRLDPMAIDLQPFEVIGGRTGQDVSTTGYRHFQYEYDARYFGELFGEDVPVPELTISYRILSRLESGETIEGRELQYTLPPLTMRILSLVPGSVIDIREIPPATLTAIDTRYFRASTLDVAGIAALILAGVMVIWITVGLLRQSRAQQVVTPRLVPNSVVLLAAARALGAVRRQRYADGWSSDLAVRALSALRIAGSIEMGQNVAQVEANPNGEPGVGQLAVRTPWPPRRSAWVSGSATPVTIRAEINRRKASGLGGTTQLDVLQRLIASVTATAYARNSDTESTTEALDEVINSGEHILRIRALEHLWIVRMTRTAFDLTAQLWRALWAH